MKEPDFIIEIFLKPGEMHWGETDTRIRTILGSCVAICLWHPVLKVGGMCHYLLPSRRVRAPTDELDGRYGEEAMEMLMKELQKTKALPKDYNVKIFGGANMFSEIIKDGGINVGEKNIAKAAELMTKHGFKVTSQDTGGIEHRSILFDVWSGDVWLKKPKKE
ncbi:MAG: chemotaxis protein CheD [Spirochaetia bacterium]|nr:chemotaxis protein CheD [Spirochaetia bacterium]